MLDRADRLHRQFAASLEPQAPRNVPNWEPPIDVVDAGDALLVHIALPGVAADSITLSLDAEGITLSALRPFPCRQEGASIHRVEIPYGRFERRIAVAGDELELFEKTLADGILTLAFRRKDGA